MGDETADSSRSSPSSSEEELGYETAEEGGEDEDRMIVRSVLELALAQVAPTKAKRPPLKSCLKKESAYGNENNSDNDNACLLHAGVVVHRLGRGR